MAYADEVLADSPWGFWRFTNTPVENDGSGTDFTAGPGLISQRPALVADGGYSVAGSGSAAIASLPSVPAGLSGGNVTLEVWVNIPAANVRGPFINVGTHSSNGWAVGVGGTTMDNDGHQLILLNEAIAWVPTGHILSTGIHHVVVTRSAANLFTAYVDGVSVYSGTFTPNGATGAVTVGGSTSTARSLSASVDVDNAAIYASALSSARVTAHYNGGAGDNAAVAADSPVVFLKLDGAYRSAYDDASGNARHLTAGGTAPTLNQAGPVSGGDAVLWPAAISHAFTSATTGSSTATLEVWVYIPSAVAAATQILGRDGEDKFLYLLSDGRVRFDVYNGASRQVHSTAALAVGTWHHIVASVGPAGQKLRINKTTHASVGTVTTSVTAARPVYIHGGSIAGGASFYTAEHAYYTTQLTDTRTDAHYDAAAAAAPVTGSLASTLPALTVSLSGTSLPPPVTGSLAASLPAPTFTGEGGSSAAEVSGALGATLPVLTVNLSGAVAPVGSLAAPLPALTSSLSGIVAAPGEISGVLATQLPTIEALFRGGSATPTTDTFNRSNGRSRSGTGWANLDEPVAAVPATVSREPIRVMAQSLAAPTLEKGRPV